MTAPFRLTPTPQPGESGRFHVAKSESTLAVVDAVRDDAQDPARRNSMTIKIVNEAMDFLRITFLN